MYAYYKQAAAENGQCLESIYERFSQVATACLKTGEMKDGDSIMIPTSAPSQVEFVFRKNVSNTDSCYVYVNTYDKHGNCTELIKPQMTNDVKSHSINVYESALHQGNFGIGEEYPKALIEQLEKMIPGETIVFGQGQMYICTNNNGREITMINACGPTTVPSLAAFAMEKKIIINLDNRSDIQQFYNDVKQKYIGSVMGQFTVSNNVQRTINQIMADLTGNKVRMLKFGPIELHAKKKFMAKGISWYDGKGTKIAENQVKCLIAWLNSAPVITDFVREEETYQTFLNDMNIQAQLEMLYAEGKFAEAYELLGKYVVENKGSVTIDTKSYVKEDNEQYSAVSYVFKEDNGICEVYKLSYENNDFSKEIKSIKRITKSEFIKFCMLKHTEHNLFIQQTLENALAGKLPSVKRAELNSIVERAQKSSKPKLAKEILPTRGDVNTLIDSYSKKTDMEERTR